MVAQIFEGGSEGVEATMGTVFLGPNEYITDIKILLFYLRLIDCCGDTQQVVSCFQAWHFGQYCPEGPISRHWGEP
jgi:hypothetical protein